MIKVIADSTCDLSPELLERYGIDIIPLHVHLGEDEFLDGVNITPKDIFKWSDEHKTTPKTSAPAITDVMDIYRKWLDQGYEIVVIPISSKFSTTVNVLNLAAEELEATDRISVIDSLNLSTGIGLLVIEAAILATEGKSRAEIEEQLNIYIPRSRASFVVDTLVYLHRGGRCSGLAALAGSALKLHPRIVVEDGAMHSDKKYRGSIDRVMQNYAKDLESSLLTAKKDRVFITHTCVTPAPVEAIREYLKSLDYFDEIIETRAGGVISSHCGPGTLGVLFIQ